MRGSGVGLVVLVALLAPAVWASSDVEVLALDADTATVDIRLIYALTDDAAAYLRLRIDSSQGNADQMVNASEVAAFEAAFTRNEPTTGAECMEQLGWLRLAGRLPHRLLATSLEVQHGEGATTSGDLVRFQAVLGVEFTAPSPQAELVFTVADIDPYSMLLDCGMVPATSATTVVSPDEFSRASFLVTPREGHTLLAHTVRPGALTSYASESELRIGDAAGRNVVRQGSVALNLSRRSEPVPIASSSTTGAAPSLPAGNDPQPRSSGPGAAPALANQVVLALAASSTLFLAVFAWRFEATRWMLARFVALAGFTRLERDEVLEHPRRELLYQAIQTDPGQSLTSLGRRTGMAHGVLLHHLRILQGHRLVRTERRGARVHFFLPGATRGVEGFLTSTQRTLLDLVHQRPGATQTDLIEQSGLARDVVSYNMNRLAAVNLVRVQTDGKWRRYFDARTSAA